MSNYLENMIFSLWGPIADFQDGNGRPIFPFPAIPGGHLGSPYKKSEKSDEYGKCPETAKKAKSLEYEKCQETAKKAKSLEYGKCQETAKKTNCGSVQMVLSFLLFLDTLSIQKILLFFLFQDTFCLRVQRSRHLAL